MELDKLARTFEFHIYKNKYYSLHSVWTYIHSFQKDSSFGFKAVEHFDG